MNSPSVIRRKDVAYFHVMVLVNTWNPCTNDFYQDQFLQQFALLLAYHAYKKKPIGQLLHLVWLCH